MSYTLNNFPALAAATEAMSTEALIEALREMETTRETRRLEAAEHAVRTSIIETLEARFDVDAVMNAWAEDLDSTITYAKAIIAAVRSVQAVAA